MPRAPLLSNTGVWYTTAHSKAQHAAACVLYCCFTAALLLLNCRLLLLYFIQYRRMMDHSTFKAVLEKLDDVHDLLRANTLLSRRLVQVKKKKRLNRAFTRALIEP